MTPDPAAPVMTDIHDIKPLLDIGSSLAWWKVAAAAAAVAVAVLVIHWLWRRRKPGHAAEAEALLSPDAEAYRLLDQLAAEERVEMKLFYFRLSAILRRYVERRFAIPAAEMTTEELLPALRRLPLTGDLVQALTVFCRESDPIKFAGVQARRERFPADLAFVRDFVRRTTSTADEQRPDREPLEPATPPARIE